MAMGHPIAFFRQGRFQLKHPTGPSGPRDGLLHYANPPVVSTRNKYALLLTTCPISAARLPNKAHPQSKKHAPCAGAWGIESPLAHPKNKTNSWLQTHVCMYSHTHLRDSHTQNYTLHPNPSSSSSSSSSSTSATRTPKTGTGERMPVIVQCPMVEQGPRHSSNAE